MQRHIFTWVLLAVSVGLASNVALISAVPTQAALLNVGPGPTAGFWGTREVIDNGPINSIAEAATSLLSGGGTIIDGQRAVINFHDPDNPGSSGLVAGDEPYWIDGFPPAGTDDENFTQIANGWIRVPAADTWTFFLPGDDGFRLTIVDAGPWNILSSSGNLATTSGEVLEYSPPTSNSNTFATVDLAEGDYRVEYLWYEHTGGAYNELHAAQGVHTSFDANLFKLAGDSANGGLKLVVPSVPYIWDNFNNNSDFADFFNWVPTDGAPPGAGAKAIFNADLSTSGRSNAVIVPDGTEVDSVEVITAAVVELQINGRFDVNIDSSPRTSLQLGQGFGDTAALRLQSGELHTAHALVQGQTAMNITGAGTHWRTDSLLIAGDMVAGTAAIELTEWATVSVNGNLDIGDAAGSGRVVVDGFGSGATPTLWTVAGSVDIGPTSTTGFNFGAVTLQNGGRMHVDTDVGVHGTSDVASTLTVQTSAGLDVMGNLNIGPYGTLELFDSTSTITTRSIGNNGGTFRHDNGVLTVDGGELQGISSVNGAQPGNRPTIRLIHGATTDAVFTLLVGDSQEGKFEVQSGSVANVSSGFLAAGFSAGGSGEVIVEGDGSMITPATGFVIGRDGVGVLGIYSGGAVVSSGPMADGVIGNASNSESLVEVVGVNSSGTAPSRLALNGQLYIGHFGRGMLVIDAGAVASTADAFIARQAGSAGSSAVVAGEGLGGRSTWDVHGSLYVGGSETSAGDTAVLTVQDGALVNVAGTGLLRVYNTGTMHLNTGSIIEADTVELAAGAAANFHMQPESTLQVNRLAGFGPHPVFHGNLVLGSHNGPNLGQIRVAGGESLAADSILVGGDPFNPATFHVASGGVAATTGPGGMALTSTGRLTGAGEVVTTALENAGVVAPGSSAGTLVIDGDYYQPATGKLEIEIGGENPGLEFDTLFVTGEASLDGILDVSLVDPLGGSSIFTPKAGNRFEILSAIGGLGGTTFATVPADLPGLTGALVWDIFYGGDFVRLDVLAPFTADFDGDGDVDGDDRTQWQDDFGGPGSDADGDGDSDGRDFLAWQQQFGSGVPLVASPAAVPEPASAMLLVAGVLGVVARRRRL